ncbi:UDP-N-acetylmuramate--L-alanine ligase [Myxococcota bacterium]|nr:UDP-N-acetylmuramate--L-alanine ligase [Myxococcota bacterium]
MHLELSVHRRVHLLGIGGVGVSAVARLLLGRGLQVSGSDVRESSITRALRQQGATVHIGHREGNLEGADLVVVSTAIPESNPELQAARRMGLPVVHRSVVLGALMEGRQAIGVTGTNGKGSVSAMTTFLLDRGGLRPAFAIGAMLLDYGTNARETGAPHLVCELDESDGSCANTRPRRLVVNNLEADHLNHYRDLQGLLDHFSGWLARPDSPPILHVAGDDANCREVIRRSGRSAVTFGISPSCDYRMADLRLEGLGSRFRLAGPGGDLGEFRVSLPGAHNARNALAAISVAIEEGVAFEAIREALPAFRGLENRFTLVPAGPCLIVKDYISHPSGIRSVLQGARVFAPGRIVAVFKPYRFTMIHYLGDEYREAFREADLILVTELYTAGEVPIPGVDAPWLVAKIGETGREVAFVPDEEQLLPRLRQVIRPDDTVIFFGGDDLFGRADVLAAELGPPTIRLKGVP